MAPRMVPVLVRPHVRGGHISPDAANALTAYFSTRPGIRAGEAADHGFDPLTDPRRYMASELAEPAHANLRSRNELTPADLAEWGQQEDAEWAKQGVVKEQPTSAAVHIDRPLGADKDDDEQADDALSVVAAKAPLPVTVLKHDAKRQVVTGIVLQPDEADSQGDEVSKEDIETAAWRFLYNRTPLGLQHGALAPDSVRPVESYLAPVDFTVETPRGPEVVRKGSWIVAAHVPDPQVWADVESGRFGGWSVAGTGKRR